MDHSSCESLLISLQRSEGLVGGNAVAGLEVANAFEVLTGLIERGAVRRRREAGDSFVQRAALREPGWMLAGHNLPQVHPH